MNRILFGAVVAAVSALTMTGGAVAGSGCRAAGWDNPMVSREGFGLSRCQTRGPRYFSRAHLGEGARGYARRESSDPMVWPDSKWRGRLFDGYARSYDDKYDRRFRRAAAKTRVVVRHLERIVVTSITTLEAAKPVSEKRRGPKMLHLRTRDGAEMIENGPSFVRHKCRGILVLTWSAGGARSRCHDSPTRIRTPR